MIKIQAYHLITLLGSPPVNKASNFPQNVHLRNASDMKDQNYELK